MFINKGEGLGWGVIGGKIVRFLAWKVLEWDEGERDEVWGRFAYGSLKVV